MSAWAYECQTSDPSAEPVLVACLAVDAMPAATRIVRVQVGKQWQCAIVDKTRQVEAAGMLLREVIASDATDCPECAAQAAPADVAPGASAADEAAGGSTRQVQAAAIAVQGRRFVVVLVGLDLVNSAGEADMAITDLRPRFSGVDLLLMAQLEDGTPVYHGDPSLVALLAEVPVDRMPWKSYPIG